MGNERWILEHSRSTAAEGRRVMFGTTATGIALAILLPVMFPDIWDVDRVFSLAFYGILAVVMIAGIGFGVQNIRSNAKFHCRLSTDRLDCHCPVFGCGETFSIAVREISKIEEATSTESASSWYIWDDCGHRHNLTTNYGNPVERFIEHIRHLNPTAEEIRT